ncbi:MAG TPA: sugar phosphate isomerase/epimerase [Planctomycetota bacterium]|nr:sugar phosphate isomerase/epimerase [Planctomycetota bacterium]
MLPTRDLCFVLAVLTLGVLAAAQQAAPPTAAPRPAPRDDSAAEQLGWRLALQAWTFRDRTAFEAIDTAAALGLKYIELYPGQRLGKDFADAKVAIDMPKEQLAALVQKLANAGIKVTNFGVVNIGKDEVAARKLFAFGKALGLETLSCEPDLDAWDTVEKLCEEFKLNAACHDHPKPSTYWNPDTVLAAVKGRSKRLGACADTGHWPRSGLVAIDCLKQLEGRIISLHFKDIRPADNSGIDQPWGSGSNDARGMLTELRRQGFRGVIAIEYETGAGKELEANVARCIAFFDQVAAETVANKPAK